MTLLDDLLAGRTIERRTFKSDEEAHRVLANEIERANRLLADAVLSPEPTLHTTLCQIARLVCGELKAPLSHLDLIAKVQSLKDRLQKAEDMVAKQAGELHQLRNDKALQPLIIQKSEAFDTMCELAKFHSEGLVA